VKTTAWRWTDNTGNSTPGVVRSGPIGAAAAVAFAFLAGTGGVTSPSYFNQRQQRGYASAQLRPSEQILVRHLRGPEACLAQIRTVLKLSISDIASIFSVSRQSIYNWLAGEKPSQDNVERLNDFVRAADLLQSNGFAGSSYLVRRKIEHGKTLMDIVRDGGSAQDAARSLLQIAQKEGSQREALQRRLANRTGAPDYSEIGSPMLNEDLR
jgi:DNA-binding transcriptional regulator YiaG